LLYRLDGYHTLDTEKILVADLTLSLPRLEAVAPDASATRAIARVNTEHKPISFIY